MPEKGRVEQGRLYRGTSGWRGNNTDEGGAMMEAEKNSGEFHIKVDRKMTGCQEMGNLL